MADSRVGQLQRLHQVTAEQLAAHPSRAVAVLGVAGGNGLDLIDPEMTDAVCGLDINPSYLAACDARYRPVFGDRLHLVETDISRSVRLDPIGLLIANLIIEYVGLDEFVTFIAANADRIGTLSCVVQRNGQLNFVSDTEQASSFSGLASISSDIDPGSLTSALSSAGFRVIFQAEYPLPNGKSLVRCDYRGTQSLIGRPSACKRPQ
ncbi:MAG: hypothetical protein WAX29_10130 [Propionibacterium sp.]